MNKVLSHISRFFSKRKNRRLFYLAVLCLAALGNALYLGFARRTFVFYSARTAGVVVEERFLRRAGDRETDIRRYVEQALLGPKYQGLVSPFVQGIQVQSFMYREGVVFANLTEQAALPPEEGGAVFYSLLTLNKGIRRNFSGVRDVRLFIGGNQIFFEEFREIFMNRADNSRT
ncbi:MAG: GerMN domain-containing protein [Treponema sp.]|nr:GerMN domain-containing protein [Treponema sp.]